MVEDTKKLSSVKIFPFFCPSIQSGHYPVDNQVKFWTFWKQLKTFQFPIFNCFQNVRGEDWVQSIYHWTWGQQMQRKLKIKKSNKQAAKKCSLGQLIMQQNKQK